VPALDNALMRTLARSNVQGGARSGKSKAQIYTGWGQQKRGSEAGEERIQGAQGVMIGDANWMVGTQSLRRPGHSFAAYGKARQGHATTINSRGAPHEGGILLLPKQRGARPPAAQNRDLTVDDLIEEYDAINYVQCLEDQAEPSPDGTIPTELRQYDSGLQQLAGHVEHATPF